MSVAIRSSAIINAPALSEFKAEYILYKVVDLPWCGVVPSLVDGVLALYRLEDPKEHPDLLESLIAIWCITARISPRDLTISHELLEFLEVCTGPNVEGGLPILDIPRIELRSAAEEALVRLNKLGSVWRVPLVADPPAAESSEPDDGRAPYIVRMRCSRVDYVGPFPSEEAASNWGSSCEHNPEDDPRWQVVRLTADDVSRPLNVVTP